MGESVHGSGIKLKKHQARQNHQNCKKHQACPKNFKSRKLFGSATMRILPPLSTAMKFISPAQYTKSNQAHYVINTSAANDFVEKYAGLGAGDSLLDFGCGTGETTIAMAQGVLGKLGNPGKVLGVDISDEMISHCSEHYDGQQNLSFQTLDVSNGGDFCQAKESSFDMASTQSANCSNSLKSL